MSQHYSGYGHYFSFLRLLFLGLQYLWAKRSMHTLSRTNHRQRKSLLSTAWFGSVPSMSWFRRPSFVYSILQTRLLWMYNHSWRWLMLLLCHGRLRSHVCKTWYPYCMAPSSASVSTKLWPWDDIFSMCHSRWESMSSIILRTPCRSIKAFHWHLRGWMCLCKRPVPRCQRSL